MPAIVLSREFTPQINVDPSTHLKGSVFEEITVVTEVEVTFSSTADTANNGISFTINAAKDRITRNTGSFIDDEFSIGDTFIFTNPIGGAIQWVGKVTNITDEIIFFTTLSIPVAQTAGTYTDAVIDGSVSKNGLIYSYSFAENNDTSGNFVSPVTGQPSSYYASDINGAGAPGEDMQPIGTELQWYSPSYVSNVKVKTGYGTTTAVYEITHTFTIQAWFLEQYSEFLAAGTIPTLFEQGTIKYISQFEFRNTYSNPNSSVTGTDLQELGSVGWWNQNFKGFNDVYSLVSTGYKNSLSVDADGLIPADTTTVTIVINSSSANFTTGTKLILDYSLAPTAANYLGGVGTFDDIWTPDNAKGTANSSAFTGSVAITTVTAVLDSTSQITLTAEIIIPGGLVDTDEYILGLLVEKQTTTTDLSDKVHILVDYNTFDKSVDVDGLIDNETGVLVSHNVDYATAPQNTDFKGWIQDGIVFKFGFDLVNLALPVGDPIINTIDVSTIAYNSTSGDSFELTSFPIPLDSVTLQTISGQSTQQINLQSTRGFNLATSDEYNYLNFVTGSLVGSNLSFTGEVGIKIPWQDWVALPDADTVFLNNAEPNKGLNMNASNYSLKEGYAIRVALKMNIQKGESATDYRIETPDLQILDFAEDGNTPVEWTGTIETFSEDGAIDYLGAVSTNSITKMVISWIPTTAIIPAGVSYAIHRAEPSNSPSDKAIQELSSIRPFPSSDVLQPVTGETQLKITATTVLVTTECFIDPSKMDVSNLNISGRLSIADLSPFVYWDGIWKIGGATGIFEMDMAILDYNYDPFTAADIVRVKVTDDNAVVLEVLTGDYGIDISAFSTTLGANPQTTSLNNVASGIMQNVGTLSLPKATWANAQTIPKTNALSTKLTLGLQGEMSNGAISLYDDIEIPFFSYGGTSNQCYPIYVFPDGKFLTGAYAGTRQGQEFTPDGDDYVASYSGYTDVGFRAMGYTYDAINDIVYMNNLTSAGIHAFPRANFLNRGGSGLTTETITGGTSYYALVETLGQSNGKAEIWNSRGNRFDLLRKFIWDGAVWQNIDFNTQITTNLSALPHGYVATTTTHIINDPSNGSLYIMVNGFSRNGVIRGRFTGIDRNLPSDWTFEYIINTNSIGDIDGDGATARTNSNWANMTLLDYDSNGNPVFYMLDAVNIKIKKLYHNGGSNVDEALNWNISDTGWFVPTNGGTNIRTINLSTGVKALIYSCRNLPMRMIDVATGTQTEITDGATGITRTRY